MCALYVDIHMGGNDAGRACWTDDGEEERRAHVKPVGRELVDTPVCILLHMRQVCNCNQPGQTGQANITEPAKVQ